MTDVTTLTEEYQSDNQVTLGRFYRYLAWGAQLKMPSFPYSYIPTTTTSATRAADVVTCIGDLDTLLTALPFSLVADVNSEAVPNASWSILGDQSLAIALLSPSSNTLLDFENTTFTSNATLGNSLTFTGGVKVGLSEQVGALSIVGGGGTVVNDTIATAFTTPVLGGGGGIGTWYGYFRRLTVWNSRLADATLQALTAP